MLPLSSGQPIGRRVGKEEADKGRWYTGDLWPPEADTAQAAWFRMVPLHSCMLHKAISTQKRPDCCRPSSSRLALHDCPGSAIALGDLQVLVHIDKVPVACSAVVKVHRPGAIFVLQTTGLGHQILTASLHKLCSMRQCFYHNHLLENGIPNDCQLVLYGNVKSTVEESSISLWIANCADTELHRFTIPGLSCGLLCRMLQV